MQDYSFRNFSTILLLASGLSQSAFAATHSEIASFILGGLPAVQSTDGYPVRRTGVGLQTSTPPSVSNASVACQVTQGFASGAARAAGSNQLASTCVWDWSQVLRIDALTPSLVGTSGTIQIRAPLATVMASISGSGFYSGSVQAGFSSGTFPPRAPELIFGRNDVGLNISSNGTAVGFTFGSLLEVSFGGHFSAGPRNDPGQGSISFSTGWNGLIVRDSQGNLLTDGVDYTVFTDLPFPAMIAGGSQQSPVLPSPSPAPAPPPPSNGGPQFCAAVVGGQSCSPRQGVRFTRCTYQNGILVGGNAQGHCPISGGWTDPPMAFGFGFQARNGTRFTEINDFPIGFEQPFTVAVGDNVLGTFGPGQPVDFVALTGAPVTDFAVTGIAPEVDESDPTAFPIQLSFEDAQGDFDMFPLPEPTRFTGLAAGAMLFGILRRRRGKRPSN